MVSGQECQEKHVVKWVSRHLTLGPVPKVAAIRRRHAGMNTSAPCPGMQCFFITVIWSVTQVEDLKFHLCNPMVSRTKCNGISSNCYDDALTVLDVPCILFGLHYSVLKGVYRPSDILYYLTLVSGGLINVMNNESLGEHQRSKMHLV